MRVPVLRRRTMPGSGRAAHRRSCGRYMSSAKANSSLSRRSAGAGSSPARRVGRRRRCRFRSSASARLASFVVVGSAAFTELGIGVLDVDADRGVQSTATSADRRRGRPGRVPKSSSSTGCPAPPKFEIQRAVGIDIPARRRRGHAELEDHLVVGVFAGIACSWRLARSRRRRIDQVDQAEDRGRRRSPGSNAHRHPGRTPSSRGKRRRGRYQRAALCAWPTARLLRGECLPSPSKPARASGMSG